MQENMVISMQLPNAEKAHMSFTEVLIEAFSKELEVVWCFTLLGSCENSGLRCKYSCAYY